MMKLAIMTWACQSALESGKYTADEFLDTLSAVGVSGLEPPWVWCSTASPTWRTLQDAALERGFSFPCLDVPANLSTGDEEKNREILQGLRQVFVFCRDEIACPVVLLYGSKPAPGMSLPEGRRQYGEMLGRCAELAAEYGVTVCIEDFGGNPEFSSTSAQCLEVLSYSSSSLVRLNFDNGNFLLGDERPLDALENFKSRLIHVHIKDFQRCAPDAKAKGLCSVAGVQYQNCALGDGVGEVEACIRRLHEIGYQGWLSAEISTFDLAWIAQEIGYIAERLQQLKKCL